MAILAEILVCIKARYFYWKIEKSPSAGRSVPRPLASGG